MREGIIKLSDSVSYLPASSGPLSADVFLMETNACVYVYDVGSCAAARELLAGIEKEKIVVLSHFHDDHTKNIGQISYQALYAGRETLKHVGTGNAVEREICLESSIPIRLLPIASSHAKGCVLLCYGTEYAFCGDALYASGKRFPAEDTTQGAQYVIKMVYNAQKLKEMIETLKQLEVNNFVLSHEENPVHPKDEVIRSLELIYQRRDKDDAYIFI